MPPPKRPPPNYHPVRYFRQPTEVRRTGYILAGQAADGDLEQPGFPAIKKFKDHKVAASRIWERIQGLGAAVQPQPEQPAKPKAEPGQGWRTGAKEAPVKGGGSQAGHQHQTPTHR
jgi:hypothetical protein